MNAWEPPCHLLRARKGKRCEGQSSAGRGGLAGLDSERLVAEQQYSSKGPLWMGGAADSYLFGMPLSKRLLSVPVHRMRTD